MSEIQQAYAGRRIFMTGTTGFVGKCLLEKMLRDVPDLDKVFILIRPKKNVPPQQRAINEIATSPIFNRLREKIDNFEEFFQSKVVALAGDITKDDMGLSPADLARVFAEVHYIMNCAANVDFNERIDGALTTNCRGPLRMLSIANRCANLMAYIHVSTAYVNCNQPDKTLVPEELPKCQADGETVLSEISKLTPEQLEQRTAELLKRDKYPNTYTFTKAMGEKLLCKYHKQVPVGIVRPSIIGAAWEEPEPGWVDTVSAGGALYLSGGLGLMQVQAGNAELVGDQIPVDLVVNTIIVAGTEVARQGAGFFRIYQSGSSTVNPVRWSATAKAVKKYWSARPSARSNVKVGYRMINNPLWYQVVHMTQVTLPSLAFSVYARLSSSAGVKRRAATMRKVLSRTRLLSETFYHFVNNEWFFANNNTKAMEAAMQPRDRELFVCSPDALNWERYFDDFQYGLQRYVLKDDVLPAQHRKDALGLAWSKGGGRAWLLPDLSFALAYKQREAGGGSAVASEEVIRAVIASEGVKKAAAAEGAGGAERAEKMVREMAGAMSGPTIRLMAWVLAKVNRRLFSKVLVDHAGLERLKQLPPGAPVVLLPTHKSYLDFLLVSWVLFVFDAPMPHIAAGDNFLNVALVASLFRWSGAFFIPRTVAGGSMMAAVLAEYTKELLRRNQWLEFFLEGSRSRTGRVLPPKTGLLSMVAEAWAGKPSREVHLVPISISYDKCPEVNAHVRELLGGTKNQESIGALLASAPRKLGRNFGAAQVLVGEPLAVSALAKRAEERGAQGGEEEDEIAGVGGEGLVREMARAVMRQLLRGQAASPSGLVAAVLLGKRGAGGAEEVVAGVKEVTEGVSELRRAVTRAGGHVLDGGMIRQDVEVGLGLLREYVAVEGEGRGARVKADGVVRWRAAGAVETALALHYFVSPMLHLFAREATVLFAVAGAGQGAGMEAVVKGASRVRQWLGSEVLYARPAGIAEVLGLLRPMVEGHWATAMQMKMLLGKEGGKGGEKERKGLGLEAAANVRRLFMQGRVGYGEAGSTAVVGNAVGFLVATGALTERRGEVVGGRGGADRQRWVSLGEERALAEAVSLLASLRAPEALPLSSSELKGLLGPRPKL